MSKQDVQLTFSIVIPTYNRGNLIEKTINAILDQNFNDFEVLVIDDGSTDNTEEIVIAIDDPRLFYHKKENGERGAARNYGARLAKGAYINFFDSDDLVYPHHLDTAKASIEKLEEPEVFHLGYDVKDPDGNVLRNVQELPDPLNDALATGNHLSCNGVFVRRDIALDHPFNEDRKLSAAEDYELWMRLASRYPFHHVNAITSTVINHDARSVVDTNPDKLVERVTLLIHYLSQDPEFMKVYGSRFHVLKSGLMFYIALHLAMAKKYRGRSLDYLRKGLALKFSMLFTRRFLGVIKNLIL